MKTVETVYAMKTLRRGWNSESVGFVPTMGALHEGHLALMRRACKENSRVVVSIFVNPTQFNNANDLDTYPRPVEKDLALLRDLGVHAVFLPNVAEMYGKDEYIKIVESHLSESLCGPNRPGHFDGMLTVVMKLLQLVGAHRAYFGEKDYQQLALIKAMATACFLETEIVGCATVRESDGLAMSSRNLLLTEVQRARAPEIYRVLKNSATAGEAAEKLTTQGFKVEYVTDQWGRRFAAAFLGDVRLIDNVAL